MKELFSHEKFIAIDEFNFRPDAAVDPIAAAQVLQNEPSRLGDDTGMRAGHVGIILEDQIPGGAAQGRFRLVEFELGDDLTIQLNMLKFGTNGSLLQLGDIPHHGAFCRPCAGRVVKALCGEPEQFTPQKEYVTGKEFPILPLADKRAVLAVQILEHQFAFPEAD